MGNTATRQDRRQRTATQGDTAQDGRTHGRIDGRERQHTNRLESLSAITKLNRRLLIFQEAAFFLRFSQANRTTPGRQRHDRGANAILNWQLFPAATPQLIPRVPPGLFPGTVQLQSHRARETRSEFARSRLVPSTQNATHFRKGTVAHRGISCVRVMWLRSSRKEEKGCG